MSTVEELVPAVHELASAAGVVRGRQSADRRTTPTSTAELYEAARRVYRQSVADGQELSGDELGAMFRRSGRWGRDRIAEAKAEMAEPGGDADATAVDDMPPADPPPAVAETITTPADPQPTMAETIMDGRAETLRAAMAVRGAVLPVDQPPAVVNDQSSDVDQTPDDVAAPAAPRPAQPVVVWPIILLALPAFIAVWSGWVGLGGLTGFGVVHPLPGIADNIKVNTAVTLPIGMEVYGAYALYVWLSGRAAARARRFAAASALVSLAIGALGQIAYHLLVAAGVEAAPWWITTAVACLPVAVLGMGAALAHLVRAEASHG